jgi:hypothetical protein
MVPTVQSHLQDITSASGSIAHPLPRPSFGRSIVSSCDAIADVAPPDRPTFGISCRRIRPADLPQITDLLCEGFPNRTKAYWQDGLRHLASLAAPGEPARFGYVLAVDEVLVGVLLLIAHNNVDHQHAQCNVSSWYVRPVYRAYAPILVAHAVRDAEVGYVNISPAKHTLPIIEAQSFVKAVEGCFIGLPALAARRPGIVVNSYPDEFSRLRHLTVEDDCLLRNHAAFGCVCLWLETAEGGYPFVFRKRVLRLGRLPCAMLLYCRCLEVLERFAGPVGRALLRHGLPLMVAGTERPLRGIIGRHFPTKMPIYYKGAMKPRSGDLSYTEAALFGI